MENPIREKGAAGVPHPYDEVPYGSRAIPSSHPDRLALQALLRGLEPAPTERCRVLELGCAEAANLAAMAFHLDESRFVGIDSSSEEIERAEDTRDRLGLDNLDLRLADITELGEDLGVFDYIIAHGVLSWVDEAVRTKILQICHDHLAPQGVAYLSYNCTPGWALKSRLRRALQYHVRDVADPAEKILRMRELLTMFAESPLRETPYGAMLAQQAGRALMSRDQYLLHEFLSPTNKAFDFREIIELTEARGLSFLGELSRATIHRGIEDTVRDGLAARYEDRLESEELADLMLFRAFRISLFGHSEAVREGRERVGVPAPLVERATFAGAFQTESKRPSFEPDVNEVFVTPEGAQVAARHSMLKAALLEIGSSWPRGLRFDELVKRVELLLELRRVSPPGDERSDEELDALWNDLLELRRLGHLDLRLREPEVATELGSRPKISSLTRLEVGRGPFVTSPYHDMITLDTFTRRLASHLDGSRDLEALVAKMSQHFETGDLEAANESGEPLDGELLAQALPSLVEDALSAMMMNGLLV